MAEPGSANAAAPAVELAATSDLGGLHPLDARAARWAVGMEWQTLTSLAIRSILPP